MYAYYVTVEVRTKKALGTTPQDKLRDAILHALDDAMRAKEIPYVDDIPTATIGGEERV